MQHFEHSSASFNHIHHGGLIGLDHAALYSGGWNASGIVWHHNWVHDHLEKCVRGDDQSLNMTVHHNVMFNCGTPVDDHNHAGVALILKGNNHTVRLPCSAFTFRCALAVPCATIDFCM